MNWLLMWLEQNAVGDDVIPGAIWHDGCGLWEVVDALRLAAYIEEQAA